MGLLDWAICLAAVVLMVVQGWWVSGAQKTTDDYFVGGRQMGWLAVGLSMFAATFSPLSFVGMPREAAYDNYHLYLAVLFIPLVVAPLAGWLFVPLYHRLRLTSAYEYLELRFDRRLRRCGSLLMGLYTLSWMGTMLYAVGLVAQAAFQLGEAERVVTMIVLGGATTAYTALGGYKAAVWTNVLKSALLAGVVIAILVLAVARVDGGLVSVWRLGLEHDKFAMFDVRFDLTSKARFWPACAFGLFVYLAVAVASQAAVQRYASLPSAAAGRRMLAVHGIGTALVCLLFFVLGTTMFAFYTQNPARAGHTFPELPKKDQLTMHFVRTELAYPGLVGLLLAGLFTTVMGSVSSGLSSVSSLLVCDWLPGRTMGLRTSRRMSAVFGTVTVGLALVVPYLGEHVFDIIIRISGAFFGPLLGLFVLGAAVRRANAPGALIGLAAGGVSLALTFPSEINAWWYGAFTCLPTLAVGACASLLFPAPPARKTEGLLLGDHPGAGKSEDKPGAALLA
jgi:SSS family solute:Na+ symporter